MSLRRLAAVALVASSMGCRRHRASPAPRRERDPRAEHATACEDPRFVFGRRFVGVPRAPTGASLAVPLRVGGARAVVAATAEGVRWWRERDADAGEDPGATLSTKVATSLAAAELSGGAALVASAGPDGVTLTRVDGEARVLAELRGPTQVALASVGARALAVLSGGGRVELLCVEGTSARPCGVLSTRGDDGAVTAAGAGFGVAWREGDRVRVQPRALDGAPRASAFDAVTSVGVGRVAIAYGGGRYALAWADRRGGDLALHSGSVSPWGGVVGEPQRLSVRLDASALASMVWDGGAFGVAWWEPVAGGHPRSYLAFVGRDGRRIGTAMRIYVEDDAPLRAPSLRWEGPNYALAAVRGDGAVETRRTGPLGCDEPLDLP